MRKTAAFLLCALCFLVSASGRPFFVIWPKAPGGGAGFITAVTNKVSTGNTVDAAAFTTGSFTPTANALLVATFTASRGSSTDPGVVAVTDSAALTWTQVSEFAYITSGATRSRLAVYAAKAPASPASMTVTGTYGGTCSGSIIHVFEVIGSDVANGVAQTFVQQVQSVANTTATTTTVTLAAAGNSRNRTFFAAAHNAQADDTIVEGGFTEIADQSIASPGLSSQVEWRSDAFETTPSVTWTTSALCAGIGFEVKAQ